MLLGASRVAQMPDQFAGRAIDIDAFQSAEFFPREVDDVRAAHHANADAFAIENIAAQDRPPIEASQSKAALFGGDSQINSRFATDLTERKTGKGLPLMLGA